MARSLKSVLENKELSEILLREPWFVFLPGYSSVKSVVNEVLIMFEKPVWTNKTINNMEVLGWISSMVMHLDDKGNAIKRIDANFGHPNFKVTVNDTIFKRAEDLAKAYVARTPQGRTILEQSATVLLLRQKPQGRDACKKI